MQTVDRREDVECSIAHTTYQMRKALEDQSAALAALIGIVRP